MSPSRHPDRRTLVRSAAWSVPVIVMATAAPAMAATGPAALSVSGNVVRNGSALTANLTIINANTMPSVGFQLVLTVTPSGLNAFNTSTSAAPTPTAQWGNATAAASGLTGRAFTYLPVTQIPGLSQRSFSVVLTLAPLAGAGNFAVSGTLTNGGTFRPGNVDFT